MWKKNQREKHRKGSEEKRSRIGKGWKEMLRVVREVMTTTGAYVAKVGFGTPVTPHFDFESWESIEGKGSCTANTVRVAVQVGYVKQGRDTEGERVNIPRVGEEK